MDGRMRWMRPLAISLTVFVAFSAKAKPAGNLTDTGAFQAAFQGSFYGFDICGDAATGQLYRKALAEKVAHCPFTADTKAEFKSWMVDADTRMTANIQHYIAEHDKLPESLDEKRVACRKEKDTIGYRKAIALLAGYAKGEVGFDAVVPDACDMKAGAP
jgi:hypothetical protein